MYYTNYATTLKNMIGMAVVDDDELRDHPDLRDDPPSHTSPVQQLRSPSPPPMRERAMAQRRPVSIPDIVGNMAGKHPVRKSQNSTSIICQMVNQNQIPLYVEMLIRIVPI